MDYRQTFISFVEPLWGPHSFQLLVRNFTPIDY